ncbi:MAG: hypothetical protein QM768_08690 [Agriterribacter sp.]
MKKYLSIFLLISVSIKIIGKTNSFEAFKSDCTNITILHFLKEKPIVENSIKRKNYTTYTLQFTDGTLINNKTLYGLTDKYTGESIIAEETLEISKDKDVDNIIYFKKGNAYYKRVYTIVKADWFGHQDDWFPVFNKILQRGDILQLGKDSIYDYNGSLTVIDKNLRIIGNNATLRQRNSTGTVKAISQINTQTPSYNVNGITYTSSNNGITTITVNGSNFQAGNVLKIYSADTINNLSISSYAVNYEGEFIVPIKVENLNNVQKLYFQDKLFYTYKRSVKIAAMPLYTANIENLNIENDAVGPAIHLERTYTPTIINVRTEKLKQPAINVWGCFLPKIDRLTVNTVEDAVAGIGQQYSVGYGVNAGANFGLVLTNSSFFGLRHAYTTTWVNFPDDWLFAGMERNASISNNLASNCQIAWDTHPVGTGITFQNNIATNCQVAFEIRTGNVSILSNTVDKCNIFLYSYNNMCDGLKIQNNVAAVSENILKIDAPVDVSGTGKIIVKANSFSSASIADVKYVSIESSANTYNVAPLPASGLIIGTHLKLFSKSDLIRQGNTTANQWLLGMDSGSDVSFENLTLDSISFRYWWRNSGAGGNNSLTIKGANINSGTASIDATSVVKSLHSSVIPSMSKLSVSDVNIYGSNPSSSAFAEINYSNGYDINSYIAYKGDKNINLTLKNGTGNVDLSSTTFTLSSQTGTAVTITNNSKYNISLPELRNMHPVLQPNQFLRLIKDANGWFYSLPAG